MPARTGGTKTRKTTITLPEHLLDTLQATAKEEGKTVSEVLRRAAEVDCYLSSVIKEGQKILVEHRDKSQRELVLLR